MGTYNLAQKYETKLDQRFAEASLTDKWCGSDYTFDGVNAIKVWTHGPANINTYTLNPAQGVSRFGQIHEVEDELNTYQLTQKFSFNESFDDTNNMDQMFTKKANAYLKQVWDEQVVPDVDAYRLKTWAEGAGQGDAGNAALTKSNVVKQLLLGHAALSNKRAPRKNRVTFITETLAVETKLASELGNNQTWTGKAIINGQIGDLNGYPVVSVPDDLMPAGVQFMIKYKSSTIDPMKMRMLRTITNSENVAGVLMQGLWRYDSFVLANKANGIYVYSSAGKVANPTFSATGNAVSITCTTSGAVIKYTTDGTNPKTSSTAKTYSEAVTATAGMVIRAYAAATNSLSSAIVDYNHE